jgi:hypothetical protein
LFQNVYSTRDGRAGKFYSAELLLRRWSKDFAMQNCFVENLKGMIFLSKHFNSSLVICDTMFFDDKTELIPIIYHKNCIRYSIFKHNSQNILGALRITNSSNGHLKAYQQWPFK